MPKRPSSISTQTPPNTHDVSQGQDYHREVFPESTTIIIPTEALKDREAEQQQEAEEQQQGDGQVFPSQIPTPVAKFSLDDTALRRSRRTLRQRRASERFKELSPKEKAWYILVTKPNNIMNYCRQAVARVLFGK